MHRNSYNVKMNFQQEFKRRILMKIRKTFFLLSIFISFISIGGWTNVSGVENELISIEARKIVGEDTREKVIDTTASPYSSIAYVQIHKSESSYSKGTAFLVGNDTLLTAAHVAVNFVNNPKYRHKSFVAPGQNGTARPFGKFYIESVKINPNFNPDQNNRDSDIAIIKVKPNGSGQSISSIVPKLTVFNASNDFVNATVVGYSGDKPKEQWYATGKILQQQKLVAYYDTDTFGGNSGSPVFNEKNDIVAVHVAGQSLSNGQVRNIGTRITGYNYDFLLNNL